MFILLAAATTFEIQPTIDHLAKMASSGRSPLRQPLPTPGEPPAKKLLTHPKASSLGNAPNPGAAVTHPDAASPDTDTPPQPVLPHQPASPHRIETLITGVGSLATTWAVTRQIERDRPDIIIQAGIAGCFTGRPPGEVMVVGEELLGDLGVWEDRRFNSLFDLHLLDRNAPPFTDGRLVNPHHRLLSLTALTSVRGITVNEITTDHGRIEWHQQNTAAVVESMEGGALHYVCLQEAIAFLQLRSVSNAIGIRDKTKWDITSAIANLNTQLISLLDKLDAQDKSILEK